MFKLRVSPILIGFFVCVIVAFPVRSDEIRFLHHFNDMEPDLALGNANPVAATAKIVDNGWNFYGNAAGSGLEVVNGVRLDFNSEDNIDWHLGSLEFWVMPYVDLRDATNHKFFCTPFGHDTHQTFHIWKTACCEDLRFRVNNQGVNLDAVWGGAGDWEAEDWHHIAATWDNDGEGLILYTDGEVVATKPAAVWEFDAGYDVFSVGGQGGATTTNGVIDELVIYDYVVSEEEVMERFNATKPLRDKAPVEARGKLTTTWGRLKDR